MGLSHYLFSFEGRINRAKQWAVLLVALIQLILIGILFACTISFDAWFAALQEKAPSMTIFATPQAYAFDFGVLVLYLVGFYISLSVSAKRLHDRNKSAWWLLIFVVLPIVLQISFFWGFPDRMAHFQAVIEAMRQHQPPPLPPVESQVASIGRGVATLIGLWAFVELYFLRGTTGENRFGPDPLA